MKWKQWIALGVLTSSALAGAMMLTGCGEIPETQAPTVLTEEAAPAAPVQPVQAVEPQPAQIRTDLVELEITDASPSHLKVRFQVLKDPETTETTQSGPITLEKQAGEGWEPLEKITDLPEVPADPVAPAGKGYWYDRWTDFTRDYGLLSPGVYRIHWQLLRDQEPVVFPFSILPREDPEEARAVERILESLNQLRQKDYDISAVFSRTGEPDDCRRYLRSGKDRLQVGYRQEGGQPVPFQGGMLRDGIAYLLKHEDINTNDSPIYGWEPTLLLPPGIRLEGWMPLMDPLETVEFTKITPELIRCRAQLPSYDPDSPEPYRETSYEFDGSGALTAIRSCTVDYARNHHDSYDEMKSYEDMEILESSKALQVIHDQKEAKPRPVSWAQDKAEQQAASLTFRNTEAQPVTSAIQALERAKAECTVKFDGTMVYYDPEAGIWKLEFQQFYGLQGYQYIYLDDQGVTQMIVNAGPKDPWSPEE